MAITTSIDPSESQICRRPARRWRDKFRDAGRGVKLGVRGHCSFFGHFFAAALVIAAAAALQCGVLEWAILAGCIGAVLTTELLNSALETLVRELGDATGQRFAVVLDIAAGAVLMASATAAIVGGIVLGSQMWDFLK